jgi:small conductance mechanosensitive channel
MSHNTKIRSVHMRFNVAYGTDMNKAMKVVRDAVIESEYSEPEWKNKDYGPVYFISYADSSLVLATTVYYKPVTATEIVISDINMRVNDAFAREGIEIPFNYVNVVMKGEETEKR